MKEILRLNDYPDKFVRNVCRALLNNNSKKGVSEQQGDVRWVSVPYVKGMSKAIANILQPFSIKVADRSVKWKWSLCSKIKDSVAASTKKGVVYRVPCADCDAVNIDETMRTLSVRLQEHKRHTSSVQL